jgi:hypothetical protein
MLNKNQARQLKLPWGFMMPALAFPIVLLNFSNHHMTSTSTGTATTTATTIKTALP